MSAETVANKSHWTTTSFTPGKTVKYAMEKLINKQELEQLRKGVIPEQMEDKWFVYCDSDYAYFHRSWTGYLIYQVKIDQLPEEAGGGAKLSQVEVNNDPEQYGCSVPVPQPPQSSRLTNVLQSISWGVKVPSAGKSETPEDNGDVEVERCCEMIDWAIESKVSFLEEVNRELRGEQQQQT